MDGLPVTLFDVLVIAVVALSALVGLARGAVAEILGLASWIGAAVVAYMARPYAIPLLREAVGNDGMAELLAVAGVFLITLLALKVVTGMIVSAVTGGTLGAFDKILGLGFGAARGAVLVVVGYLIASQFLRPEAQPDWITEAQLIGPVQRGSALLARYVPAPARTDGTMPTAGPATGPDAAAEQRQALDRLLQPQR